MSDDAGALREYLVLLNRFGLSEDEIASLHWSGPIPDDVPVTRVVAHVVGEGERTPDALFDRLLQTLAASRVGVDAPREYSPDAPADYLTQILSPYDISVSLTTTTDEPLGVPGDVSEFVVRLTDASGRSRETTFEYPEHPLGQNNLPALFHAVETELLADTGLTFSLLTERDDRWRFVLLGEERSTALEERYGERIDVLGHSLYHDESLAHFAEPQPVDDAPADDDADAHWLTDGVTSSFEDVGFQPATVESPDEEPDDTEVKVIDEEEEVDELFASMEAEWGTAGEAEPEPEAEPSVETLVAEAEAIVEAEPERAAYYRDAEAEHAAYEAIRSDPSDVAAEPATVDADADGPTVDATTRTGSVDEHPDSVDDRLESADGPTIEADEEPDDEDAASATPEDEVPTVTPSDSTTPAVRSVETDPTVAPGDDPSPAVRPVEDGDAAAPDAETADDATADAPPAVSPGTDPVSAVRAAPSEPDVAPGTDPTPAIRSRQAPEKPAVEPGKDVEPAVRRVDAPSPPDVVPGQDTMPAITPTEDESASDAGTGSDAGAEMEVEAETDVDAEADVEAETDVDAETEGDAETDVESEPSVSPTAGDPIPAVRRTADSEADAIVDSILLEAEDVDVLDVPAEGSEGRGDDAGEEGANRDDDPLDLPGVDVPTVETAEGKEDDTIAVDPLEEDAETDAGDAEVPEQSTEDSDDPVQEPADVDAEDRHTGDRPSVDEHGSAPLDGEWEASPMDADATGPPAFDVGEEDADDSSSEEADEASGGVVASVSRWFKRLF